MSCLFHICKYWMERLPEHFHQKTYPVVIGRFMKLILCEYLSRLLHISQRKRYSLSTCDTTTPLVEHLHHSSDPLPPLPFPTLFLRLTLPFLPHPLISVSRKNDSALVNATTGNFLTVLTLSFLPRFIVQTHRWKGIAVDEKCPNFHSERSMTSS